MLGPLGYKAAALLPQTKEDQTVRTCRSRAADAAAASADDAVATLHQKKVASREADAARNRRSRAAASVDRMQLMPLPRLQTTRRPRFTSREGGKS